MMMMVTVLASCEGVEWVTIEQEDGRVGRVLEASCITQHKRF